MSPLPVGFGHFHKTLKHNELGEVDPNQWETFLAATKTERASANPDLFAAIPEGAACSAQLNNPLAGLAIDPLVPRPETFKMPAPPDVTSLGTAAEMTELYWMALLRDVPFDQLTSANADLVTAAAELDDVFRQAREEKTLSAGVDLPKGPIDTGNVFRLGLPGDDVGPLVSQFWLRDIRYGTQTIDQRQTPYRRGLNFLTEWDVWLHAQNSGRGADGSDYPRSNDLSPSQYLEGTRRYVSCMRDLARFVNKDALHQAYFNAALLLLNGGAKWTPGNPYTQNPRRDSGFGTLGGPHILALVSEVASRALEIVWHQKWQEWLRLRPEAYAGALQVQELGAMPGGKKNYGLQAKGDFGKEVRRRVQLLNGRTRRADGTIDGGTLLLPIAFTAGSPVHPSYGAGHATVAGACVTVLKAFFQTLSDASKATTGKDVSPLLLSTLLGFPAYTPGITAAGEGILSPISADLTIEGELNKLAANVAMGRTMGGVHFRTDNTRSLLLGEAIAAHVLAALSNNLAEKPTFVFRTFGRTDQGDPRLVRIKPGNAKSNSVIEIDGDTYLLALNHGESSLSDLLNPPGGFKLAAVS